MSAGRRRRKRGPGEPWDGIVVVDKPAGWTSHDVVGRLRSIFGTRRVGHAGTLDPAATGVLVCAVGRGTRLLTYLTGADKRYRAVIRLGASTVTEDAEGGALDAPGCEPLERERVAELDAGMAALTGELMQRPSAVSAVKVDGRRAYDVVRAGGDPKLQPRPVTVSRFERLDEPRSVLLELDGAEPVNGLEFAADVECSSGTYVRALARDLGEPFGGGHLGGLRRIRVGPFTLDDAVTLDELASAESPIQLGTGLGQAAQRFLPSAEVDAQAVAELTHGRRIPVTQVRPPGSFPGQAQQATADAGAMADPSAGPVALVAGADGVRLIAVAAVTDGTFAPSAVFADPPATPQESSSAVEG